jgi:hypothetical protein
MAEQPDHVFKTKPNQTKYLSVWFEFRFGFFEFDLARSTSEARLSYK